MRRRGRGLAPAAAAGAMLAALGLAACDGLPGRPRPESREGPASEASASGELYARNCAGCHGMEGRLGAASTLNDPVYLAVVPPDQLRTVIAEGVPGTLMPGYGPAVGGPLSDAQVDALVKGMLDRWARPEVVKGVDLPPYDSASARARGVEPGDPERGAAVFAAACARCHGADGAGGPGGGPVVDPTYLALVSDQHLRTTVIAGRPDLDKPDWRADLPGQPLTPQQISDVVAWLASHRGPVPGRPGTEAAADRPHS